MENAPFGANFGVVSVAAFKAREMKGAFLPLLQWPKHGELFIFSGTLATQVNFGIITEVTRSILIARIPLDGILVHSTVPHLPFLQHFYQIS